MNDEQVSPTPVEAGDSATAGHAADEATLAATGEEIEPSVEESEEDQVRARDQSAYADPFTAMPIA